MIKKTRYVPKGIDQDTTPTERGDDSFYDSENIRLINNGRNLSIKPVKEFASFCDTFAATEVMLGSIEIRGYLYIFTTETGGSLDHIAKIDSDGVRTDLLNEDLSFDENYRIEAVANYENDDIIKIYWTDGLNLLRFINVSNPDSRINIVEEISMVQPTAEAVVGGNLLAGNVQYVYNLYNLNGSQSVLSPISSMVSLTEFMDGKESGQSSGMSALLSIPIIDTNFDYIKVYSIHYQELNQSPAINLIIDESISTNSLTIVDDGNTNISNFTDLELFSIGTRPLVVGTLAAKKNRLFIANYSEANFDVIMDTRVFAHSISSTNYRVKNVDGSDNAIRVLPSVPPDTHDAINYDYTTYSYITNSTTKGAEGSNIKLEFDSSQLFDYVTIPDKSLKQNEIYRVGVIFRNVYGQKTPVKWMADVKIPEYPGSNGLRTIIGLKINLTTAGVSIASSAGAVGYDIVSVERKLWDRTIVSQGFIVPGATYEEKLTGIPLSPYTHPYYLAKDIYTDGAGATLNIHSNYEGTASSVSQDFGAGESEIIKDDTIMFFYSSDTVFESTMNSVISIRVIGTMTYAGATTQATKIVGYDDGAILDQATESGINTSPLDTIIGDPSFPPVVFRGMGSYGTGIVTAGYHLYRHYETFERRPITDSGIRSLDEPSLLLPKSDIAVLGNTSVSNIVDITFPVVTLPEFVIYATKFNQSVVLKFNNADWHKEETSPTNDWYAFTDNINASRKIPIVELIRDLPNQYGGGSYEAKQRNIYLNTGNYINSITTTQYTHYIGDIYVGPLQINRCDSEHNVRHKSWNIYEYISLHAVENNHNVFARSDNMYTWGIGLDLVTSYELFRIEDNQKLASGYNQKSTLFTEVGKPANYTTVNNFPNTIQPSNEKFPNELIDNWTNFPVNETHNLEGINGAINKLHNFKGEIMAFQDKAIAHISINPRIQTQATDGINIELGIGAVLYDHKYITTKSGTTDKFTVTDDGKNIYYYDRIYNTINIIEDTKLSTLLGIRNILENTFGVINAVYNRELDEVIFSIDTDGAGNSLYSVIYSSILNKFMSKHTSEVVVDGYNIVFNDKFIIFRPSTQTLYEKYAGTNYLPSSITYMFAPEPVFEKVFHNLEYRLYGDMFTKVLVTGNRNVSDLEDINVKTKFDINRAHLPRIADTRERFREIYILVKLINDKITPADYSLDDMVIMYNVKG